MASICSSLALRQVGNTQSAADVDEVESDAEGTADVCGKIEKHAGGLHHILIMQLVRGEHRVQSEPPGAPVPRPAVGLDNLVVADAVLGLDRVADDVVADPLRSRIVTEADEFRHDRDRCRRGRCRRG